VTGDLYASSDFGVMRLPNAATTWVVAGGGLPMVEVAGLTIGAGLADSVRRDARAQRVVTTAAIGFNDPLVKRAAFRRPFSLVGPAGRTCLDVEYFYKSASSCCVLQHNRMIFLVHD